MTLEELIEDYKDQAAICAKINYSIKSTIKDNNKSVHRMYEIVNEIRGKFGQKGIEQFQKLLDIKDNEINVWAATQLLEKLSPDKTTETKAIEIIKQIANSNNTNALGFKYWLKEYETKKINLSND